MIFKNLTHIANIITNKGFNAVPLKRFERDEQGNKRVEFFGSYSQYRTERCDISHFERPFEGLFIVCGQISNLTILDIDSEEAKNLVEKELGKPISELSNYIVKTTKGYQLFFTYETNLKSKIALRDKLDLLSEGRITFADPTNPGYEIYKDEGEILPIPAELREYITKDKASYQLQIAEKEIRNYYKNPLCKILEQWLESRTKPSKRLISTIQSRLLDGVNYYEAHKEGSRHILSMRVAGIVAADPTCDDEIFDTFCRSFIPFVIQPEEPVEDFIDYAYKHSFDYDEQWQAKTENPDKVDDVNALLAMYGCIAWFEYDVNKYCIFNEQFETFHHLSASDFKVEVARVTGRDAVKFSLARIQGITKVYDPTIPFGIFKNEKGERCFNYFKPSLWMDYFDSKPQAPGKIPPFINAVLNNVFPVAEHKDLFLHNLAFFLKYKMPCQTAIISLGATQGVGKGILYDKIMGALFNGYHLKWEPRAIQSNFNGELENKLFVHCNEMSEHKSRYSPVSVVNVLKNIIAESTLTINGKGKEFKNVNNYTFVCMSSNEVHPFDIDVGDNRRFNFFPTSDKPLTEVYPKMLEEGFNLSFVIEQEMRDFVAYLAHIPLSPKKYMRVIKTEIFERIYEESKPFAIKVAEAIIAKDEDVLEELLSPEAFEMWRINVMEKNLSYVRASEMKKHFERSTNAIRAALQHRGVKVGKAYIKAEKGYRAVWFWNPTGELVEQLVKPIEISEQVTQSKFTQQNRIADLITKLPDDSSYDEDDTS